MNSGVEKDGVIYNPNVGALLEQVFEGSPIVGQLVLYWAKDQHLIASAGNIPLEWYMVRRGVECKQKRTKRERIFEQDTAAFVQSGERDIRLLFEDYSSQVVFHVEVRTKYPELSDDARTIHGFYVLFDRYEESVSYGTYFYPLSGDRVFDTVKFPPALLQELTGETIQKAVNVLTGQSD